MYLKVLATVAVVLFAVFVGFVALLAIIAYDAQYPDDGPQRVYTYEGDADTDWYENPGLDGYEGSYEGYYSERAIPADPDEDEECISISVRRVTDSEYSMELDTDCVEEDHQ